jgi:hypothetical protein
MRVMKITSRSFGIWLSLATLLPAQVELMKSPAPVSSAEPNLTVTPSGRVLLSWVQKMQGGHALYFASRNGAVWSEPKIIAKGDDWFVNWADFPSLVGLMDGSLVAHWLVKSGRDTYDYDVHIARSMDGGDSWGSAIVPHRDQVKAEHGFVSLLPCSRDAVSVVWLDGRSLKQGGLAGGRGSMTLRYVEVEAGGALINEALLDERVCECCQTSAAMSASGPVIVYRDRSDGEVRDIAIIRRVDGQWQDPHLVYPDGWKIAGCPVNGPSVAASGKHVAVAWFSAANDKARVQVAMSHDCGATFADPVRLDEASPLGRADVVVRPDGSAFVCWLARGEQSGLVRLARLDEQGDVGDEVTIAKTGSARANGFPRMVLVGDDLLFAWTDDGVQTAQLRSN